MKRLNNVTHLLFVLRAPLGNCSAASIFSNAKRFCPPLLLPLIGSFANDPWLRKDAAVFSISFTEEFVLRLPAVLTDPKKVLQRVLTKPLAEKKHAAVRLSS